MAGKKPKAMPPWLTKEAAPPAKATPKGKDKAPAKGKKCPHCGK